MPVCPDQISKRHPQSHVFHVVYKHRFRKEVCGCLRYAFPNRRQHHYWRGGNMNKNIFLGNTFVEIINQSGRIGCGKSLLLCSNKERQKFWIVMCCIRVFIKGIVNTVRDNNVFCMQPAGTTRSGWCSNAFMVFCSVSMDWYMAFILDSASDLASPNSLCKSGFPCASQ